MCSRTRPAPRSVRLALLLAWLAPARVLWAQPQIDFEVRNQVSEGQGKAGFVALASEDVRSLTITLVPIGRGKKVVLSAPPFGPDSPVELSFAPPRGTTRYRVAIAARFADGSRFEEQREVSFEVLPPMQVRVPKESVDLDAGQLTVICNNEPRRAVIELVDLDGETIRTEELTLFSGAATTQVLRWQPPGRPIKLLRVLVYDALGSYGGMEFFPFQVQIPHRELVFDTGSDGLRPDQQPIVAETYGRIVKEVATYGADLTIRLYIAGFTDTVGPADANQALSERRARSIAQAFRDQGLRIPIFYQGFGERVLAVSTPDETPEERNRRALYILSDHTPEVSSAVPPAWRQLP